MDTYWSNLEIFFVFIIYCLVYMRYCQKVSRLLYSVQVILVICMFYDRTRSNVKKTESLKITSDVDLHRSNADTVPDPDPGQ